MFRAVISKGMSSPMEKTRVILETARLRLIAPDKDELAAAALNPKILPQLLQVTVSESADRKFYRNKKAVYRAKSNLMENEASDWLFCTAWQITVDCVLVGEAGFKGAPDGGELEIGYALRAGCLGNGYMTEAVSALCRYAFADARVQCITAVTRWNNFASHRVLLRCGFSRSGFRGIHYLWKKYK
jgi:RimJ/RimL family protein N-acetyltransferase